MGTGSSAETVISSSVAPIFVMPDGDESINSAESSSSVFHSEELFTFKINDSEIYSGEDLFSATFNPESYSQKFGLIEYAVFISVLICSAAIGIFYGFFNNGQKSTEEYLMGNRKMSVFPVALSLLSSFVSAITVLGNPIEVYMYGSTYGLIVISFIPMTWCLAYCYVPVYHNLQLTSAYEYLELRFSRGVRVVTSLLGILQYVIYMSIVVYGPALALSQVTGISTRVNSSVMFSICIFYSTLGGLPGVVFTDILQFFVMIGSLIAIVTKGVIDTGGFEVVWDIAEDGNRASFFNFDLDPRTRHTVWTSIFGGFFMWLGNFGATHSQVQRYLAIPTLMKIRRALMLNFVGLIAIFSLCYLAGLNLYARYHTCDPIQTKAVQRPDQLLPLYVMETLGDYKGLPGLFVAGVTCASLSSVSSGLNSLSAILTYDYVKQWWPTLSDATLLRLSKTFCVMFGIISFGFVFVAENLGNILPVTISFSGGIIGPILGVFSLGMFFPWANSKGATLGLLTGIGIMAALIVSRQMVLSDNPNAHVDQKLAGLSTEGCGIFDFPQHNTSQFYFNDTSTEAGSNMSLPLSDYELPISLEMDLNSHSHKRELLHRHETFSKKLLIFFTEISYMWYPAIGCTSTVIMGLLFSFLLKRLDKSRGVNPDYLSPPALWLLIKLFPDHIMNWLEVDGYPMLHSGGCSFTLSVRSDFSFNKDSMCDIKLKKFSAF